MRPRPAIFIKCPKCGKTESAMPARRERRKKDISTWSMVIPFHSRQFTVAEIDAGEWWCSACDKAVEHALAADYTLARGVLENSVENPVEAVRQLRGG